MSREHIITLTLALALALSRHNQHPLPAPGSWEDFLVGLASRNTTLET